MRKSLEVRELAAWLEEGVGQVQMVGRCLFQGSTALQAAAGGRNQTVL